MATQVQGLLGSGFAQESSAGSSSQSASAFNLNSFLTMFVTQLKYQDPNNPLESHELAAQLAQFSSVEKLTQATSLLQDIQQYSIAINNAQMASLVGKDVTAQMSTVNVADDGVSTLEYRLDSPVEGVTVTITDEMGNLVYAEGRGTQSAGSYQVNWDGKTSNGTRLPNGTYKVEVQSGAGTVRTTTSGTAYACNLEGGSPYYILNGPGGVKIPASDVFEISMAAKTN